MSALTAKDWAVGVFLVAGLPVLWIGLPKYWRGGFSRVMELGLKSLPFSPATRLGWRRALLPVVISLTCLAVVFVDHTLATKIQARVWTTWESRLSVVLMVVALASFFTWLTVILYNWPKFLVPPVYRGEKGARQMWSADRARRRAGA